MKQIINIVVGIIRQKDSILLGKTRAGNNHLLFDLPGGIQRFGEHIDDALTKRICRDVGIKIASKRIVSTFDKITKMMHHHISVFEIGSWQGMIHREWRFVEQEKLPPIEKCNDTLKMCREIGII